MNPERPFEIDDRTQNALDELKQIIQAKYPDARFAVTEGDDPPGTYLKATVDVDDIDDVVDVFVDRLIDMQVEEGLSVYVIPLEPVERVMAQMQSAASLPPRYRATHRAIGAP